MSDGIKWAIKHVFLILMAIVIALLLYRVLFVGENSAVRTMCRGIEKPLSRYYYSYTYSPAIRDTEGTASDLGYSIYWTETNLASTGSSFGEVDTASSSANYTTGWF